MEYSKIVEILDLSNERKSKILFEAYDNKPQNN